MFLLVSFYPSDSHRVDSQIQIGLEVKLQIQMSFLSLQSVPQRALKILLLKQPHLKRNNLQTFGIKKKQNPLQKQLPSLQMLPQRKEKLLGMKTTMRLTKIFSQPSLSSLFSQEWYEPKKLNIVRASKYRHIFGKPWQRTQCYDNLRVLNQAIQAHSIRMNQKFFAYPWVGTAGQLGVMNLKETGRLPSTHIPTLETGSEIYDFDLSRHTPDLIAVGRKSIRTPPLPLFSNIFLL